MRTVRHLTAAIISLSLCLCLCGCTKTVRIGDAKVKEDETEITCVVTPETIGGLDQLPLLHYAVLDGSSCYEEIVSWAKSHPGVEVHYTVGFPGNVTVGSDAVSLTLSSIGSEDVSGCISLLKYLPELKELTLSGSRLTADDVAAFRSAYPTSEIKYSFPLFGEEVSFDCTGLDLRSVSSEELLSALPTLSSLDKLDSILLGDEQSHPLSWELLSQLAEACPGAALDYAFSLYGLSFNLSDTQLDLNHLPIFDEGISQITDIVSCMNRLEYLDMDFCGVSNENMAKLRDAFPKVEVVWRIWLGENYSVRTDVEKILASKPSTAGNLTDAMIEPLKYCTKLKYLDIGHNEILTDLSFARYMPELEVLVAAMNQITDLSPLSGCSGLEYLEIQTNPVTDLSPLASCTNLAHLNCARNGGITDISPLFSLTKPERLWLGSSTKCPQWQLDKLQEMFPEVEINIWAFNDPTEGRWRYIGSNPAPWSMEVYLHPRYELLCEQFGYLEEDYSFYWKDPKYESTRGEALTAQG